PLGRRMANRPIPLGGGVSSVRAGMADPIAFLSHAHAESDIALAFAEALTTCGVSVVVDKTHLQPGENITEFARDSIGSTDATVCVVSAQSLSSSWVVFEAVASLHRTQTNPAARLIACAIDQEFLSDDFQLTVTKSVDERLTSIDQLVPEF